MILIGALVAWGLPSAATPAFALLSAPGRNAGPVEIPRPSRAWAPEGETPTPETWRLRTMVLGRSLVPDYATACKQYDALTTGGDGAFTGELPQAQQAWRGLLAEPGVRAQARWDGRTGLPHRAWVSGLRLETQGPIEPAARAFVREHAALLLAGENPSDDDLPLVKAHRVGAVWFLVFGQRYHGLEVVDGRVDLRVRGSGEVVVMGSSWFPGVQALDRPLVQPSVARAVARAGVGFRDGVDTEGASDLAILPVDAARGIGCRLVHRVRLSTENPPGTWTTYIDAEDGRVWARENAVRAVASTRGQVEGTILPRTWTDPLSTRPMRDAEVWRGVDTTETDADGGYALAGKSPRDTLFTRFRSPFLRIRNQAREDVVVGERAHPPGRPLVFEWTDANSDTSERNAYYHALHIHSLIRTLDPELTSLDYRMPCRVNIAGECNAFFDGTGINFLTAGEDCVNMATVADVIYHEYTHAITQATFAPFEPNGALHEGFSDYFAASILDDPVIGRDIFGRGTYARLLENDEKTLNPRCDGDPHCLSLPVSAALWEMREGLVAQKGVAAAAATADSLWHFAGYGGAFWYDDYLLDLLVLDDDDGTLLNGTPHYDLIRRAFTRHGFQCPELAQGVWIDHQTLPDADLPAPRSGPYTVAAKMGSTDGALDPSSARLHYRVVGAQWQDKPLTGSGVDFQATIPAYDIGGNYEYWLEVRDDHGGSATSPADAPAHVHSFHVGKLRTVWADDFENNHGWYAGDDRPNSLGGWRRGDPFGTRVGSFRLQPENDASVEGHVCWVTGDTLNVGTQVSDADVDDGCTSLWSPAFDLSHVSNARLDYFRWFANEYTYDDTLWIEVSGDDGQTWSILEGQTFTENFWKPRSFDLGSHIPLTDKVRIRVTACDVCLPSITEAAFDDITITTRVPERGGFDGGFEPEARAVPGHYDLALAPGSASPTRGPSEIRFTVPGDAGGPAVPVQLTVFDVRGRLVNRLVHESMQPGEGRITWSGEDQDGRRVGPGAYAVRLEAAGRATSLKIVRLP